MRSSTRRRKYPLVVTAVALAASTLSPVSASAGARLEPPPPRPWVKLCQVLKQMPVHRGIRCPRPPRTPPWSLSPARLAANGAQRATINELPVPSSPASPISIKKGPDDALWFIGDKVGSITTAGTINEYPLPTRFSGGFEITEGPDAKLWLTENYVDRIAVVTP
ncbi:hypothetical protein [Nonomuraea sp. B19D2]|uniref:virginiamycin B lyase family protein n=1 Tax=Nonomuraea sp. B19D2 TaxID=3159561 RepID=UPI0032DBA40E